MDMLLHEVRACIPKTSVVEHIRGAKTQKSSAELETKINQSFLRWIFKKKNKCALYPSSLAIGILATARTTVIVAVLPFLRCLGQLVYHVTGVPDLVDVSVVASPHLYLYQILSSRWVK